MVLFFQQWQKKLVQNYFYDLVFKWSRLQDSNQRPSTPKNLRKAYAVIGF